MHEAFEIIPILQKLPAGLTIESISAFDDYLIVGTKSGNLLLYQLIPAAKNGLKPGAPQYDVKLLKSNKAFSKKSITQLQVVPEFQMLLCLADNTITAFDLSQFNLQPIVTLKETRGAHYFTISIQKHKTLTGEIKLSFRLCVAIKKKLQMYYWKPKDSTFLDLNRDLSLRDIPRTIVWCGESLCVGYKSEYSLVKTTGDPKDLFPTGGKQTEPLVCLLPNEQLAVESDLQTILIDSEGIPTMKYAIKWSEVPICLVYDAPYLIAVLPKSIEVRPIEPRIHVQSIDLKAKMIVTSKRGWVFAASTSDVWLLRAVHIPEQIAQLLSQKQFELALHMAEMTDESEVDKEQLIQRIENLNAFYLFCKQSFKEAMDLFLKLETDPSHVIGLFPNLLPEIFRSSLEYPDKLPNLQGTELENGLLALTDYLTQVRNKLQTDNSGNVPSMTGIMNPFGKPKFHSKKQLLQIIDTTLLKCYLQTNDGLVSSWLRKKDNYCHIDESERALKQNQKWKELTILYKQKGMHTKALELLMRQAKKADSPLRGPSETIAYLQSLGAEYIDLIFEFAKWVLNEHPEDGLKIFVEDLTENENLPRAQVLSYLSTVQPELIIPYLEFIILKKKDDNSVFHDTLVNKYCEKILILLSEYRNSLPEGHPPASAGLEPGELGELRQKLLTFLEDSKHCTVERFPTYMKNKKLYDEAAIVLGRLGRHEEALTIYIHILQNFAKAENYCRKHYIPDKPGNQDVYLTLLKLYLPAEEKQKVNYSALGYIAPSKPDVDRAISILKEYSNEIDSLKALSLLPTNIPVSAVRSFFDRVIHSIQTRKYGIQLKKSLLFAEHLQVQAKNIHFHSYKLVVTDLDMCRVCQKRIGKSAFAHFPTGVNVHYSCKDQYNPET